MIYTSDLKESDIGKWVAYNDGIKTPELGKIKSWKGDNVWVVYHCDNRWEKFMDYTGENSDAECLTFI